jgi:hypothetical protein
VFAGLPVVLAVGAGAIYAAGAITTLASLLRSPDGPEEVFVQIPVQQHLAHGLEFVVHPETCAALFLVLVILAWEVQDRPSIPAALARAPRRNEVRALVIAAVVALAILVPSRWLATLAIAATATALVYIITVPSRPAPRRPLDAPVTLVLVTFGIVFLLADAFIAPTPLPDATLKLSGRAAPVSGKLLVRTDAAWFLAASGGSYRSIPASRVTSAHVTYGQEGHGKSLFQLLFG